MTQPTQHGGRRGALLAAAATVVLVLVAGVVITLGLRHQGPPQPAAAAAAATPGTPAPGTAAPGPTRSGAGATAPTTPRTPTAKAPVAPVDLGPIMRGSAPVRLDVPSIGVHTSTFVDLGRAADGSIEVPTDFAAVGFYTPGPTPGQFGPAVIAGHVDSHQGPAVFYRLGALRAGARISVGRKDGSTATFVVDQVASYSKARFPTAEVYGNTTSRAELRLITCGGSFDDRSGHYVDNVVAFAHLVPAA